MTSETAALTLLHRNAFAKQCHKNAKSQSRELQGLPAPLRKFSLSCWLSAVEPVEMATLTVCAPLQSCLSTPAFNVLNFLALECFCTLFEAQILKKNFF